MAAPRRSYRVWLERDNWNHSVTLDDIPDTYEPIFDELQGQVPAGQELWINLDDEEVFPDTPFDLNAYEKGDLTFGFRAHFTKVKAARPGRAGLPSRAEAEAALARYNNNPRLAARALFYSPS